MWYFHDETPPLPLPIHPRFKIRPARASFQNEQRPQEVLRHQRDMRRIEIV
jgi:hypothetical protein